MDDRKEKNTWLSVPQFGDWDQKHDLPDYSMDFSKIREMRKQNKRDLSRASLGNEEELVSHHQTELHLPLHNKHHNPHYLSRRKKILSYFNCCIKAKNSGSLL